MDEGLRRVKIGDRPVNLGTRFGRLAAGGEYDLTSEEAKRVVDAKAGHYTKKSGKASGTSEAGPKGTRKDAAEE